MFMFEYFKSQWELLDNNNLTIATTELVETIVNPCHSLGRITFEKKDKDLRDDYREFSELS